MARQKKNSNDEALRRMVDVHLRYREQVATAAATTSTGVRHLDEDSLAAFIGGNLSQTESVPLVSHLVGCGFCRRATAQLVRLESELAEMESVHAPQQQPEPGRIRRLLDSLAARVLPQSDEDAVFAYHAPAEDLQQTAKATQTPQAAEGQESAQSSGESVETTGERDE